MRTFIDKKDMRNYIIDNVLYEKNFPNYFIDNNYLLTYLDDDRYLLFSENGHHIIEIVYDIEDNDIVTIFIFGDLINKMLKKDKLGIFFQIENIMLEYVIKDGKYNRTGCSIYEKVLRKKAGYEEYMNRENLIKHI